MKHGAGIIRLHTLTPTGYWVDRHGNRHALKNMKGAISTLGLTTWRQGRHPLRARNPGQESALLAVLVSGRDSGEDTLDLFGGEATAEAWVEKTLPVATSRSLGWETGRMAAERSEEKRNSMGAWPQLASPPAVGS